MRPEGKRRRKRKRKHHVEVRVGGRHLPTARMAHVKDKEQSFKALLRGLLRKERARGRPQNVHLNLVQHLSVGVVVTLRVVLIDRQAILCPSPLENGGATVAVGRKVPREQFPHRRPDFGGDARPTQRPQLLQLEDRTVEHVKKLFQSPTTRRVFGWVRPDVVGGAGQGAPL